MLDQLIQCIGPGIVVRDMSPGDFECYVQLLDTVSPANKNTAGAVSADSEQEDMYGNKNKLKVVKTAVIRCQWLALGCGNRTTAPVLGKGQKILVFKIRNTEEYFWQEFGIKPHLTKKDVAVWLFPSFKQYPGADELDPSDPNYDKTTTLDYWNSSYKFEVDTIRQYIELLTSNKAGEKAAYKIALDLKNGTMQFVDNYTTGLEWLSTLGRMRLRTRENFCARIEGALQAITKEGINLISGPVNAHINGDVLANLGKLTLVMKEMKIEALKQEFMIDGDVMYKVKGNFKYHTPGDVNITSNSGKISFFTNGAYEVFATGGATFFSPAFTVNGVINGQALNLGGGGGSAPSPEVFSIERTDLESLKEVLEQVVEQNKIKKEMEEEEEEEEGSEEGGGEEGGEEGNEEEKEEIEDPKAEEQEEAQQDAIADLKGEMNFKVAKDITFSNNGAFTIDSKGKLEVNGFQGISLKGGPAGDDLLAIVGSIAAEMGKLCANLVIPNSIIGVTPLGGPLIAGCAPAASQHIASITQVIAKLQVMSGGGARGRRARNLIRAKLIALEKVKNQLIEIENQNNMRLSVYKQDYNKDSLDMVNKILKFKKERGE